jgi:hypothetical protein
VLPVNRALRQIRKTDNEDFDMNSKTKRAGTVLMLALSAAIAQSADQDSKEVRDVSDRYVAPPIEFAPCAQNASAECGELIVPVDYNNPREGLFGMAVIRARATDPSRRIGVLIANPGGPGGFRDQRGRPLIRQ